MLPTAPWPTGVGPLPWCADATSSSPTASWLTASTTALFLLIPNLRERSDVTWQAGQGQDAHVLGPGWRDLIRIEGNRLPIRSGAAVLSDMEL